MPASSVASGLTAAPPTTSTPTASNRSKCLSQANYFKLLGPILFVIAFFAILQVALLTTDSSPASSNKFPALTARSVGLEITTTITTPAPIKSQPSWFEVWKNEGSFLQSTPEVLPASRSRRSQTTTTTAEPAVLSSTSTTTTIVSGAELNSTTTSRPVLADLNVTESQIKAPEHEASGSEKALQVSAVDEQKNHDDESKWITTRTPVQEEASSVYNKLGESYDPISSIGKRPMELDMSELVPGSFESLVGADENLEAQNDEPEPQKASDSLLEQPQNYQPSASELVVGGEHSDIGPLETIIHDDKAGDIRAQVGLSLHYHPVAHQDNNDGDNESPEVEGSDNGQVEYGERRPQPQQQPPRRRHKQTTQRKDPRPYRPEQVVDVGQVMVAPKRIVASPSRPTSKQQSADLNTAAGHYYGKKKKKKMVYKKKKIKKKKKKIIIIKKKKKKKFMMKKKKKKVKKYKKIKKYKKKKIVIIKKKKRKAKKYHHHGGHHHHHHHHHGGGGHGHGGKYYMYAKVPKKKSWEFGFKRGNKKHWIERHEKGHKNKFKTKVKWYDAKSKGKGIHVWDYNHHDKKKKKHYG